MKDFRLRNDTDLYFLNNIVPKLSEFIAGRKTMFVYGGGSVKKNGCYEDIVTAVKEGGGTFVEYGGCSREYASILAGIEKARTEKIELIIGAGGASVMDAAKLIAFGVKHPDNLWDYVSGRKNPYHEDRLPLILIPTYPSSGSEYGLGAVTVDSPSGRSGTAYGIAADYALLCPEYSLSLNAEMTAYTALVTLVQLSAAVIGDHNKMSYDAGVSYMRNVLEAARILKANPNDIDARGAILIGAAMSTSSRLGLGKESNYAYDIYEIEFIPENLFNSTYRKSLTTVFPAFLAKMAKYHEADIRQYLKDVYDLEGDIFSSTEKVRDLFEDLGIDMLYDAELSREDVDAVDCDTILTKDDIYEIISSTVRKG